MGRKAKYATLTKYQPYIDIIMRDLQIEHLNIEVLFVRKFGRTAGYAKWHSHSDFINGTVSMDNQANHASILRTLMHEFKHIQDRSTGKLKDVWVEVTKRGVKKSIWVVAYDNVPYPNFHSDRKHYNRYLNFPWEKAARDYADGVTRLFPGNQLPTTRKLIATTSDGVKWYKG